METAIVLLTTVALLHYVFSFYGRLMRSGIGLAIRQIEATRARRGSDFQDNSY